MTGDIQFFTDVIPVITSHIQSQIMLVRYNGLTGTCFFAIHPRGQCWVTARHVVEGLKSGEALDYYFDGSWRTFRVIEVNHSSKEQDISAFTAEIAIAAEGRINVTNQIGLMQGQSLLVFGYPHGIVQVGHAGDPFTIPICKRGSFSGAMDVGGCRFMIMDAIINPGFSGAPVFALDTASQTRVFVGIVSHFRPETDQLASLWDHSGPTPKQHAHLKVNLHSGMTLLASKDNIVQVVEGIIDLTPLKSPPSK